MTTFAQAVNCGVTQTTNGMTALNNTGSDLVTLFFNVGASRNTPANAVSQFAAAMKVDGLLATKLMFWARDVRGGAGEREVFRAMLQFMATQYPGTVVKNIHLVPQFGRWDDLLVLLDGSQFAVETAAMQLIAKTLLNQSQGYQLCAKWMPRKGPVAVKLRSFMNLSPKLYRKLLVNSTNVVETAMCSGDWTNINYSHVPSVAAKNYQKAFGRHDTEGYEKYKAGFATGETKVNASAIFPHDVIKGTDIAVVEQQWNSLPNYLEGSETKFLPMIDVSGSMECPAGKGGTTCMDVSVSLGMYLAEKQQGAFNGLYLTFTDSPKLTSINKNISVKERFGRIRRTNVGYNTNIEAAFAEILRYAKLHNVPESEMPTTLIIFSDMQFDAARNSQVRGYNPTVMQMASDMFKSAGYTLPRIVYWNLNGSYGNVPVTCDEQGTAMVSGFSPAVLKSIISSKDFTPQGIMMETLNSDRYSEVQV